MILEKYSFGVGDRFGRQGKALLRSITKAKKLGFNITPVWNKSHREHITVNTVPASVRTEADEAAKVLGFNGSYYVDADHIGMDNVSLFIDSSDFYTLDVGGFIGQVVDETEVSAFKNKYKKYAGSLSIPGIDKNFEIRQEQLEAVVCKFLPAVKEASRIYRHIEAVKGADNFITEVSMDETNEPQTPVEMFFILAVISGEGIPAQTIAPKFIGRFCKGVDYVGSVDKFAEEIEQHLAVIDFAVREFSLPENLKLSVHSGSDKFSIYKAISKALKKFDAGLHIKTSGTTWLEELAGLAMADGDGLSIAKKIYGEALLRFDELCGPYASVVGIDRSKLPSPKIIDLWSGAEFASALRHERTCDKYNPNFRQLLHIAYKIAAEMGDDFLNAVVKNEEIIAQNVTENIYERHIKPIFMK